MSGEEWVLGYWAIRGLAQPVRLLLEHAGIPYREDRFVQGEGPEFSREDWLRVKFTKGLDFPNLPYLIAGDARLTQSNAILRFVGRRAGLVPSGDEAAVARFDMVLYEAGDLRTAIVRLCYNPDFDALRPKVLAEQIEPFAARFAEYLDGRDWFCGELTIADFVLYELLDQVRELDSSVLANKPNLLAFLERFEELPNVKRYMASDKFIRRPINNKVAQFK